MLSAGKKVCILLIIIGLTTSSCSRHFYHLNFAKAEKRETPQDLKQPEATVDESATASTDEFIKTEKALPEKQLTTAVNNQFKIFKETITSPKNAVKAMTFQLQDIKQQVGSLTEKKSSALSSHATYPILKNEDKLLVLWVTCVGGAILFWIAGSYVEPLTFIGAFLGASAFVFFIFWLVAIAL